MRGAGAGGLHARTELTQIASIRVKHCYDAYGLAVAHRSGWKLVYSGDLRAPCPDLVRAGRGCTLLIHEATFEDKLLQHAERKQHCTVSEAVRSAALQEADEARHGELGKRGKLRAPRDRHRRVRGVVDGDQCVEVVGCVGTDARRGHRDRLPAPTDPTRR